MGKHDAVDRLMALATEKRADRLPQGSTGATTASVETPSSPAAPILLAAREPGSGSAVEPAMEASEAAGASSGRGRQLFNAVRPLLPAVAGALRMVDHGAVQAVARLLPLLGGGAATLGLSATAGPAAEQEPTLHRALSALQASSKNHRKDLDVLQLQMAAIEDESRRLRAQVERLTSEESSRAQELRAVSDRSRLLTAAVIILFMLVVAQMILLVVIYHR